MNRISVKAVVVGGVTDIVASVILPLPLIVYLIATEVTGTPKEPLQAAVMTAIRANPLLYGLESLISLACSVLGGYVAARVAKHDEMLNGLLASFLPVALGVYSLAISKDSGPLLLPVLLLIASPLCSMLGGHLRLVQIRGSAAHPQFQGVYLREDEILERARDALQKVGNGFVDAKQIESLRAALDLQAADGDRHKFRRRGALGTTPRVFLWSIVLKAFFWIIALIVIAAVVSNSGIDLFDLSKKLTGH
jgi:hypothetical protein